MAPEINTLSSGSSRQRDNLNHQAVEDYLKTIYMLAQEETPVSTSRIAEALNVKPASATSMVQRLARLNLLRYKKHKGVTALTGSGQAIALEVIRHHRLIELYLIEALGFTWDEVHEQADILEHVISEKLEERIATALGHPRFDPHGDPIPTKEGVMANMEDRPLSTLSANDRGTISRIADDANSKMLRYLADLSLTPGTGLRVVEVAPFDGPLTIEVKGEQKVIGYNVAANLYVEVA